MKPPRIFPLSLLLLIASGCSSPSTVSPADTATAIASLIRKANAGNAFAQNDLASRYQEGDGVPKDLEKAFTLYQMAAASGDALAQSNLGFMYDMGFGTQQNRLLANEWYRKSAEQGYAPAMLNLGLNISGGAGAPQDLVEGLKWIDLARFLTQNEKDMKVKWNIRRAYDVLEDKVTVQQHQEAKKRSKEWYATFKAKSKKG